jgi:hypothetical protein
MPISTRRVTRRRGVVGVEGREHQVARERRVHGDLGRLLVADLADHHHVRVLPEEGAQRAREGEPDAGLTCICESPADVVLDRVLRREDVHVGGVDAVEARVERGGLAAARRARDEDDALGAAMRSCIISRRSGAKPRSVSSSITEALLRIRITMRSPRPLADGDGAHADVDLLRRRS